MSTPRKTRVIRVVMTDREKNALRPALDVVRKALRPEKIVLRVDVVPEPNAEGQTDRRVASEQLEAAALRAAAAELDERAERTQTGSTGHSAGSQPQSVAPATTQQTAFTAIRSWVGKKIAAGWRITVLTAIEWLVK